MPVPIFVAWPSPQISGDHRRESRKGSREMARKRVEDEKDPRSQRGARLGKYEIGRTLGEGSFGKVKLARRVDTLRPFAVKILDLHHILSLKMADQIMREIESLKLLRHPNIVRLHEVLASKTKIYMVLEYVNGGELSRKIELKGKLSENEGRKLFHQLIDAVSYCHDRGVFHRDLKAENILFYAKGNIKLSDFSLSALDEHVANDGLLHTTCRSPCYVAPEVLANRGYDGAISDIWSCGVILYFILTGKLPFEDRNLVVLYQKIFKADTEIPKWLSPGAQNIIRKILDPNPTTRIKIAMITEDEWFKQDYVPVIPTDDEEDLSISDVKSSEGDESGITPTYINAFQLIGMSSCFDLSGLFEEQDVSERKIGFISNFSAKDLFGKIEDMVKEMGFQIQKSPGKLKVMQQTKGSTSPRSLGSLSVTAEVFELTPSLYIVELRKSYGDPSLYRQLYTKLKEVLGVCERQLVKTQSLLTSQINGLKELHVAAD
ncbi:hypothetical protein J5N97_014204 [Dioscorea zingiberensis]|uniref:non-specific serine/threonine protein kinase n=1 Tax=Dioscorea zingiberensis TaxID=325984 RepID=A0A9D5CUS7_9LILI|nr:hypothetical protein J5N97_014204 [Dioscorea zingiberensis]